MLESENTWQCHIYRSIICNDERLFDLGLRSRINFYHNVKLPFIPFVGLSVEYFDMSFDQGQNGKVNVKEFYSEPISSVVWDCRMEHFKCHEAEKTITYDRYANTLLYTRKIQWFPINVDDEKAIEQIVEAKKDKNA